MAAAEAEKRKSDMVAGMRSCRAVEVDGIRGGRRMNAFGRMLGRTGAA